MIKTAVVIMCMSLVPVLAPRAWCDDADLAKLFVDKKIEGTIVISELNGSNVYLYNELRANRPFVPASTFKIPNTLIALEAGVVSEKEVIKWDGKDKGVEAWNCNQTLDTAFRSSCVWFYQELARRIGTDRYKAYLDKISYGNAKPGPELTTFWLEGDLKISAVEQVGFLKKLYREDLPFSSSTYKILKRIMIVEQTPAYTIRAKSGWAARVNPQQGWYVGYVETRGQVWFFATNLEIRKKGDEALRKEITMEALKAKGIVVDSI